MSKANVIEILILLAVIAALIFDKCSTEKRSALKLNVNNDSIVYLKNQLNQEVAHTTIIEDSYKNLQAIANGKDTMISRLQRSVDVLTNVAIAINNTTHASHADTTHVVFHHDSFMGPVQPCDTVFPEYHFTRVSDLDSIGVVANKDSTFITYTIYNQFDIKQSWKRKGWFGREDFVEVTNLNPYTRTTGLSAFKVEHPKPKRLLWFLGGMVVTAFGIAYIKY